MKRFIILLLVGLMCINVASAIPPVISVYNNSISGTNMFPHQAVNTNIIFNASANQVITTWNWYTDDVNQANNNPSLTETWTTSGYKNVTVWGTNINGDSNHVTWNPIIEVQRSTIAQIEPTISEAAYNNLTSSLDSDSPDFVRFLQSNAEPYTGLIGNLFYLFIYILPIVIMWVRQEKALIPAGLGIILGVVILPFLPESFIIPAVMFLVITTMGVLYSLSKERS